MTTSEEWTEEERAEKIVATLTGLGLDASADDTGVASFASLSPGPTVAQSTGEPQTSHGAPLLPTRTANRLPRSARNGRVIPLT